jgi:lipopolysaccharide transport system permease protein
MMGDAVTSSGLAPAASAPPGPGRSHVELIEPSNRSTLRASVQELWRYRDLLYILTRRDVSVRYKQAFFGFAWAVVQPLVLVAVFAFFLHHNGLASAVRVPYPVFTLSGLVGWTFLASGVMTGSDSLVLNEKLVSKVYFPRLALPVAGVLSWLPDLLVGLAMVGVLLAVYGVAPSPSLLVLPFAMALAVVAGLSVTIWTAALNVAYRDVKNAVPFIVQFWLFATPSAYTAHAFKGPLFLLVSMNPATAVIALFRFSLAGVPPQSWDAVLLSLGVSLALLATGLRYFRRTERYFADVI